MTMWDSAGCASLPSAFPAPNWTGAIHSSGSWKGWKAEHDFSVQWKLDHNQPTKGEFTMKRIIIFLTTLLLMSLPCFAPVFGSTTGTIAIIATVDPTCAISTLPVVFPLYASTGVNLTMPDDSNGGSISLQCTAGVVATVGLDTGANYIGGVANMKITGGGSYLLPYTLYQDSGRSVAWGNLAGSTFTTPAFTNLTPLVLPVYARIPAHQAVGSGSYTDTVQVTVNF
jgi:spore coat protein U-like protein